ncbi:MAG: DUF6484 domain-containing protein [Bacteroidota bacterium]
MTTAVPLGGVCVGTLVDLHAEQGPRVVHPADASWTPLAARSIVPLTADQAGASVVLAFDQGDPARPIILGVLQPTAAVQTTLPPRQPRHVQADERTLVLEAERTLELRCGRSSITLHADGRVYIKGIDVVSRARQTNKIKGGNVRIN